MAESYKHETGSFTGKGGVEIFFQKWLVDKARAVLVLVHGLGEHSGRYGNLLNALAGKKISVVAIDHRGHGKSGGKRGHIDSFMDYVYDLKLFMEFIKEENRNLPVILFGHSMGGVIAAKYALTYPDDSSILVLSSSGFAPTAEIPQWKKSLAEFLSSKIGSLTMSNGLNTADLSHDKEVVMAYENDPLVHDRVSARWFVEFMKAAGECMANAKNIKKPLLVFHGKNDNIADYKASEEFYNSASSANKKLFIFEGLFHETMNETEDERNKVLRDVTGWILKTLDEVSKAAEKKEEKAIKPAAKAKAAPKKAEAKAAKAEEKKPAPKAKTSTKKAAPKASAKKAAPKATSKAAPKAKKK